MRVGGALRCRMIALVLFCTAVLAMSGGETSDAVTLLTPETFDPYMSDQQTNQGRPTLVMFHVGWCKVCQKAFPKFIAAAEEIKVKGFKMDFAHADCTDDKTLCQKFEVRGYPTIKLFPGQPGAAPQSYKGVRAEHAFVKYADRMTQPAVRRFDDLASFETAVSNESYVAFVALGKDPPLGLQESAHLWQALHVFAVTDKFQSLLPEAVAAKAPAGATLAALSTVAQQWPGTAGTATPTAEFFTGSLEDVAAVGAWLNSSRFPGVWKVDESNFYEFTHAKKNVVMISVDPSKVTASQEALIRASAEKFKESYSFGVLDGVAWKDELKDFNIYEADLPRVFVSEDEFEVWIEDIEQLRLDSLEEDLLALKAGAPLLRQGRSTTLRLQFYFREANRSALRMKAYAGKGAFETVVVVGGIVACIVALMTIAWLLGKCCSFIFADDYDAYPPPTMQQKKAA